MLSLMLQFLRSSSGVGGVSGDGDGRPASNAFFLSLQGLQGEKNGFVQSEVEFQGCIR